MLTVDPDIETALKARNFNYAWLLELPDGLYFTTWSQDITVDGKIYQASGHILSIPGIGRSKGIKVQDLTLTLAASDGMLETAFKARSMTGEDVRLKLALMSGTGAIISGQALGIYKGYFDGWRLTDNGKRELISVTVASPWSNTQKTAGRLTNPSDQLSRYPGDKFFEFAHEDKEHLGWGGEK